MKMTILLFFAAILAYIAYTVAQAWRSNTAGSTWERILATASSSSTILWQKFVALIAIVTAGFDYLADVLGMPDVKETIQSMMNPKYVAGFVLAVAIVTIFARRRTLAS